MLRTTFAIMLLLGAGLASARADVPANQSPTRMPDATTSAPEKRADSSVPRDGVIMPAPGTGGRTVTVTPPNVDPGMTIAPPGTPGGDPTVNPK